MLESPGNNDYHPSIKPVFVTRFPVDIMSEGSPPMDGPRPRPVCAVLAAASPFVGGAVPFSIIIADPSHGDFAFMIGFWAGIAGAIPGLLLSAFLAGFSRVRRERHPWIAASITLIALPVMLFFIFVSFIVA